uniref:Uncharacterized protein n=1 Tax=Brassica oleracea var. oleracea TaxID=109376 RepID=A0A0D3ECC1_BRAOL
MLHLPSFGTKSVDLTTKPDLEDEGASRNEESIEENNVEFVEQAMIDEASDFQRNIMRDSDDLNWRWKPDGCDLPWSNQDFIKKLSIPPPGLKYLYFRTKYSQPFLTQTKACFLKQYWSNWRHPQYNAIRFLMTILASCWVWFSAKHERKCGRGNYVQYGTTRVYTLIIYSIIGYDWIVAKSMGSACPSSLSLWNLFSGLLRPRPVRRKKRYGGDCTTAHTPVAWTLYCIITSQVGDKDLIVQIAGVGDMSLKNLLKYGFGFEHDFLPVVAAVHIG